MKELITKNMQFSIVPENIEGATICSVCAVGEDFLEIKLSDIKKSSGADKKAVKSPITKAFAPKGVVEMFTGIKNGILYFETDIASVQDETETIKINYPKLHRILQRREFLRVPMNSRPVELKDNLGKSIEAKLLDISAGGMKLETDVQLDLQINYSIEFQLDARLNANWIFQPIRVDYSDQIYTVSGRFKIAKNIDRINLVQFCFRKQLEEENKK